MPWWAPIGGITGAIAVFLGLVFVGKIGAGAFNGLLITANIIASLIIDHWGLLNMPPSPAQHGTNHRRKFDGHRDIFDLEVLRALSLNSVVFSSALSSDGTS